MNTIKTIIECLFLLIIACMSGAVVGYNLGDGGTETGTEEVNKRGTIPGISGNI